MKIKYNFPVEFKEVKRGFSMQHLYGVAGQWYPSVTSFTGLIDDGKSGALIHWAKNLVINNVRASLESRRGMSLPIDDAFITTMLAEANQKPVSELETAGDWGSQCHAAIDEYVAGRDPIVKLIDQPAKDAYENFLTWEKSSKINFISGDMAVAAPTHGFGGRLDAIGMVGGKIVLLDWKTSNAIRLEYHFQVGGYAIALEETCGLKAEKAFILRFSKGFGLTDKKGKTIPNFDEVEVDLEAAKNGFLTLLALKNDLKILKRGKEAIV